MSTGTNDTAAMLRPEEDPRVRRVELLISNLLRIGVVASFSMILLGITLTFIHHPEFLSSPETLGGLTGMDGTFPHTLHAVIAGVMEFRGTAIATLGLLLLVATPVVRVAISVFAFIYQRDRTFVAITLVVLMLLLLSFILGKAEG